MARFFLILLLCVSLASEGKETVAIFTAQIKGIAPWDPESVQSGITGSEEAVIYVSQKLVNLGYQVFVFADAPKDSFYRLPTANPRFVDFAFNDGTVFDIGISWRMPTIAKWIKARAHKVYFWPHDLCSALFSESEITEFDDVLWLSESQRQQWASLNPSFAQFTKIFGNGINPEQFREVKERVNPYSCIYGSSYDRGLEVLLNIWPCIKKQFPRATLDI